MTPEETYREYMSAIREGDRRRAFGIIERAYRDGLDLATIYVEVFQPSLRQIGRLWEEGAVTVAEEHLATAITEAAMARLYNEAIEPMAGNSATIVAAGAADEEHIVGLRMVCDLLEYAGWDVVYLGGKTPADSLVELVRDRRPDVLALSATIDGHVDRIAEVIRRVRSELGDDAPFILVGGQPFVSDPELARRIEADATARDAGEAVERLQAGRR